MLPFSKTGLQTVSRLLSGQRIRFRFSHYLRLESLQLAIFLVLFFLYGCTSAPTPAPDQLNQATDTPSPSPTNPVPTATQRPPPEANLVMQFGKGNLNAIEWSPDGELLAAGTSTGVYLYDFASPTDNAVPEEKEHFASDIWVSSLVFNPTGGEIAIGSLDGEVRLWDLDTQSFTRSLAGTTSTVRSLAFSPDGNILAIGRFDSTIWIWDMQSGQVIQQLRGHNDRITDLAFSPRRPSSSPAGYLLASASRDGMIVLWDSASGRIQTAFDLHEGAVNSLTFYPDDPDSAQMPFLASASDDYSVRLWNTETGLMQLILSSHTSQVSGLSIQTDGRILASGDNLGAILLWDGLTGEPLRTYQAHTGGILDLEFQPGTTRLASVGSDGIIKIWNAVPSVNLGEDTPPLLYSLESFSGPVNDVDYNESLTLLGAAYADGSVRLWELNSGALRGVYYGHTGAVTSISFSDNNRFLSGGADGSVRLWESIEDPRSQTDSNPLLRTFYGHTNAVWDIAIDPTRKDLFASGGADGLINLWSLGADTPSSSLKSDSSWIFSLDFSSTGSLLASGSSGGEAHIYDANTGQETVTIPSKTNIYSVAFHPDDILLAIAGDDGIVQLWDFESQTQIATLEGHTRRITSLAFSNDGKYLASSSNDSSLLIWDLSSQDPILNIKEPWGNNAVQFIPLKANDLYFLLSASRDGTIRLWGFHLP